MNYLLCLDVSTESGALRPTARSSSYCRHHVVWHARIGFAGQLDERMRKSNCLASSLPGMNQDPRTQHAFGAKADQDKGLDLYFGDAEHSPELRQ